MLSDENRAGVLLLLATTVLAGLTARAADIRISEFLASNINAEGSLLDEDGDAADWIEIENRTGATVNLENWFLTDDPTDPAKWRFPAVEIKPGGFLIVFASGKNRRGAELHTNFKLDADGDYLALTASDGTTIESAYGDAGAPFSKQRAGISYGMYHAGDAAQLVTSDDAAKILVPQNAPLPTGWTGGSEPFDDTGWTTGRAAAGYETISAPPEPELTVTHDLVLWLDAAYGIAKDSDNRVLQWADKPAGDNSSADNASSTSGHRPLFVDDGSPSGTLPVVRFDGSQTDAATAVWLDVPHASELNPGPEGLTVLVAGRQTNQTGFWISKGNRFSYDSGYSIWSSYGTLHVRAGTDAGGDPFKRGGQETALPDQLSVVTLQLTPNEIFGFLDGSNAAWSDLGTLDNQVSGSITPTEPFVIGARNNHNFNMTGDIGEILVFNTQLTPGERQAVEAYLHDKWLGPATEISFSDRIKTDLHDAMYEKNASALVRIPFTLERPEEVNGLFLNLRYDDGFVAFLNGTEILRRNAPDVLLWNASAASARSDRDAVDGAQFDVSDFRSLLRSGENILAFHALNVSADDDDFLLAVELTAQNAGETEGYFPEPTPEAPNGEGFPGLTEPPSFSIPHGFYDASFPCTIETGHEGALIMFTTDGTRPDRFHGTVYADPLQITGTTTLRAAAFYNDFLPSDVVTCTYIFLDDILNQNGAGMPAGYDYAMDPDVVYSAQFGGERLRSCLKALPVLSLVMNKEDMFGPTGLYANPLQQGPLWERETSVELFFPEGSREGFQLDAGIRVHGGAARTRPKLSFRLYFRREYGPAELSYPLYPDSRIRSFDRLVLRGGYNDTWNIGNTSLESLYLRDQFARQTQLEMGHPASHIRYVHLYINGMYWGLYDIAERYDETFASDYFGAEKELWDVMKHTQSADGAEVAEGNRDAWDDAQALANAGPAGLDRYEALEAYVNMESLADYMLINFFTGSTDWPHRNWYAMRPRVPGGQFRFLVWDTERSLRMPQLTLDRTGVSDADTPARLHARLSQNEEYRLLFADRVHRHFFNEGLLTPDPAAARLLTLSERIEDAIVAESARWGDSSHPSLVTYDSWDAERNELAADYFPRRTAIVFQQLRNRGLYPQVTAPSFNRHGGEIEPGFALTITSPEGEIYYTLNGTDPRLAGGDAAPSARLYGSTGTHILAGAELPVRTLVPVDGSVDNDWTLPTFDDSAWSEGEAGIGFDRGSTFDSHINTDLQDAMYTKNASVYVRIPFFLDSIDPDGLATLTLRMKYDDGFIAYLNGERIAERNAPSEAQWNSTATRTHADAEAIVFESIDIPDPGALLESGWNVLAVHGLNITVDSSDMLLAAELLGVEGPPGAGGIVLNKTTRVMARTFSAGAWSALAEAVFHVYSPLETLQITEIMYNPPAFGETDGDAFEFLELKNTGEETLDLSGVSFSDGIAFSFPEGMVLEPGGFLILAAAPSQFRQKYNVESAIAGPYRFNLDNSGETITIVDPDGITITSVAYNDTAPWPEEADDGGHSLVPRDQAAGGDPNLPEYWRASCDEGGSPGFDDPDCTTGGGLQIPSDLNQDARLDISDVIALLQYLFGGNTEILPCGSTSEAEGGDLILIDGNGDGQADISDAVHLLAYLFTGGPPPVLGTDCVPIPGCPDACP